MAVPASTGQFPKLLETNIRKYFFDRYKVTKKQYAEVFNIKTSDTHYVYDHSVAGFGAATPKDEGTPITFVSLTDGYDKTYTQTPYGLGFRSTYEMLKFDQSGIIMNGAGKLAESINQTIETYAAAHINNGFTSTTGEMDSTYLFSTAHPTPISATTYANRPTSGTDLSDTSLKIAIQYFRDLVDDRGFPVDVMPKKLIVPTSLEFTAREILKTPYGLYSPDRTINTISEEGITPFVWRYLTSSKAWFLAADKSEHDLFVFFFVMPMFERTDDFDTGDSKWKGYVNFDVGNSGWRGIYGNPGLGS
jgi:hypothetical protein